MDEGTGVDRADLFRWDGCVPEYDAFGREIGEDTLSGLGGSSAAPQPVPQPAPPRPQPQPQPQPEAQAQPLPQAQPEAPGAAPQATFTIPGSYQAPAIPGPRRRRGMGGLGCLIGLVVLAVVVAGPVIALVSFVGDASDAIDDVTGVLDGGTTIDPGDDVPPPPVGIAGRSMVSEANFGAALRRIGGEGFGRPMSIRLSPDRVSMQMVKSGKLRPIVTVNYLGELDEGPTASIGGEPPTFPLATIDAGAPSRLVRASAERYPALKPNQLDYLVANADPIEGGHGWTAYYKDGKGYVSGDKRGRVERRFKP